jgi:hypothetical protein
MSSRQRKKTAMKTCIASPERATDAELKNHIAAIAKNELLSVVISVMGGMLVVLNQYLQVVIINDAFQR